MTAGLNFLRHLLRLRIKINRLYNYYPCDTQYHRGNLIPLTTLSKNTQGLYFITPQIRYSMSKIFLKFHKIFSKVEHDPLRRFHPLLVLYDP